MVYQKNWTAEEDIIMDVLIQTYGKNGQLSKNIFRIEALPWLKIDIYGEIVKKKA